MKKFMTSLTIVVMLLAMVGIVQVQAISHEVTIELNNTTGIDASVIHQIPYKNLDEEVLLVSVLADTHTWWGTDSLLKFNLYSIPSGVVITSARLILTGWYSPVGRDFHELYQYLCDWAETSVTYNTTSLCALGPLLASHYVSPSRNYSNFDEPIPNWLIQGWVDGSIDNNGFYITSSGLGDGYHYYYSSEEEDPDKRPKLIISACPKISLLKTLPAIITHSVTIFGQKDK